MVDEMSNRDKTIATIFNSVGLVILSAINLITFWRVF